MQSTIRKPRCREDCLDHVFDLKNKNGNAKLDVFLTFCPKFRRDPHPPEKTIPEYNMDNRYFTNAFVLGTQKKTYNNNAQQEQMHFLGMVKDACQKNNQIFFPRPNEKNSFCSVCKEHYKNYYQHINTDSHRIKIDAAIYNNEIKKLCGFYKTKWEGAHEKADKILQKLYEENQLYKAGLTKDINQNQQNQDGDQKQQQNINDNEMSSENPEDEENNQKQNSDQNQQDNEMQNQNQESDDSSSEESHGKQQQVQVESPRGETVNKNRDEIVASQNEGEGSKSLKTKMKQSMEKKRRGYKDSGQIFTQRKNYYGETHTRQRRSDNHNFFQRKSQFVVFLHKNKNGRYQVVKDVQGYLKKLSKQAQQNAQIDKSVQKLVVQKQKLLLSKQKSSQDKILSKKASKQEKIYTRQKQRAEQFPKYLKPSRQVLKIKHPKPGRQLSSEYRNSSSQDHQELGLLCEALKNKFNKDRIMTRHQYKQQNSQLRQIPTKYRNQRGQSKKDLDRKKQSQSNGNIPSHMPFPIYSNHAPPFPSNLQRNPRSITPTNLQKMPNYQGFPMYMPSHLPPTHSHPQIGSMPMNPNSLQGNPQNQKIQQNPPSRMNPNNYMPHPSLMMNQPYYNSNMMSFGVPPPLPPQIRNTQNHQQSQQKPKQRQPNYPMYYPNTWNSYMMNSSSIPRAQGNSEGTNSMPNMPNIPPNMPNIGRNMPGGYQLLPSNNQNAQKPMGAPQGNGPPPMGGNMGGMYMPYQMDPRYYMGYQPPPFMNSNKKNEQKK